jgi:hypothetical protein
MTSTFLDLPSTYISLLQDSPWQADRIIEVSLDSLYVQVPEEADFEDIFLDEAGKENYQLSKNPLIELLRVYQTQGKDYLMRNIRTTRYFRMKEKSVNHHHSARLKELKGFRKVKEQLKFMFFKEKRVLGYVKLFFQTYESIKGIGYLSGKFFNSYIVVKRLEGLSAEGNLAEPAYEIWIGHHRAAVLMALGVQRCKVLLLKKKPSAVL